MICSSFPCNSHFRRAFRVVSDNEGTGIGECCHFALYELLFRIPQAGGFPAEIALAMDCPAKAVLTSVSNCGRCVRAYNPV